MAVRWAADNAAANGGDANRIYLMGHSAGATHVATYVGHPEFHAPKALAGAMFFATPQNAAVADSGAAPPFHEVRAVIAQRCQPCHSQYQSDRSFGPASGGVTFDTPESIARLAARIRVRAVETKTMPLANKTGMTEEERALLGRWIAAGAPLR